MLGQLCLQTCDMDKAIQGSSIYKIHKKGKA